jgi:hypothetical protein
MHCPTSIRSRTGGWPVPPYQHGDEVGYAWKTARKRSTDAERFATAHREPLEGHAGTACSSSLGMGHFD